MDTPVNRRETAVFLSRRSRFTIFIPAVAAVILLDLLSKYWVFSLLKVEIEPGRPLAAQHTLDIIPGFFDFEAVLNFGAFSGMFAGHYWFLIGVSAVALLLITAYLFSGRIDNRYFVFSLALIAGGTAGNLYDRVCYGAVRDFLHFYIKGYSWPNFNIADMSICIGVGIWVALEFFSAGKGKTEENPPPESR
jgi:signal peptidase II